MLVIFLVWFLSVPCLAHGAGDIRSDAYGVIIFTPEFTRVHVYKWPLDGCPRPSEALSPVFPSLLNVEIAQIGTKILNPINDFFTTEPKLTESLPLDFQVTSAIQYAWVHKGVELKVLVAQIARKLRDFGLHIRNANILYPEEEAIASWMGNNFVLRNILSCDGPASPPVGIIKLSDHDTSITFSDQVIKQSGLKHHVLRFPSRTRYDLYVKVYEKYGLKFAQKFFFDELVKINEPKGTVDNPCMSKGHEHFHEAKKKRFKIHGTGNAAHCKQLINLLFFNKHAPYFEDSLAIFRHAWSVPKFAIVSQFLSTGLQLSSNKTDLEEVGNQATNVIENSLLDKTVLSNCAGTNMTHTHKDIGFYLAYTYNFLKLLRSRKNRSDMFLLPGSLCSHIFTPLGERVPLGTALLETTEGLQTPDLTTRDVINYITGSIIFVFIVGVIFAMISDFLPVVDDSDDIRDWDTGIWMSPTSKTIKCNPKRALEYKAGDHLSLGKDAPVAPIVVGMHFYAMEYMLRCSVYGRQKIIQKAKEIIPPVMVISKPCRPSKIPICSTVADGEHFPLLTYDDWHAEEEICQSYVTTPRRALFHFVLMHMSIGFLAVPYAVMQSGWFFVLGLLLFTLLRNVTAKVQFRIFQKINVPHLASCGGDSFANVAFCCFGKHAQIMVVCLDALYWLLSCLICWCVVVQCLMHTIHMDLMTTEAILLVAIIVLVLNGNAYTQTWVSMMWALQIVVIPVMCIVLCVIHGRAISRSTISIPATGINFYNGIGILCFVLNTHSSVTSLRRSLGPTKKRESIVNQSSAIIFVTYGITAMAGYMLYTIDNEGTKPPVLICNHFMQMDDFQGLLVAVGINLLVAFNYVMTLPDGIKVLSASFCDTFMELPNGAEILHRAIGTVVIACLSYFLVPHLAELIVAAGAVSIFQCIVLPWIFYMKLFGDDFPLQQTLSFILLIATCTYLSLAIVSEVLMRALMMPHVLENP